ERILDNNITYTWDYGVTDLDGDSGSDIVVQKSYSKNLTVLRGRTGEVLWNKRTGDNYWDQLLDIGDVSGDGKTDLLLTDSRWTGYSQTSNLSAIRGFDGLELWKREYYSTYIWPQIAGDLDRDGRQDVLIQTYSSSGSIEAVNASSGSLIWSKSGDYYAVPAGDLSGDGYVDLIITSQNGTGAIRGYDATSLWVASGRYVTLIDDTNGDNRKDVIIETENPLGEKELIALSGSDGSQLWSTDLGVQADWVSGVPIKDLSGDRKEDIIVDTYPSWQSNAYRNLNFFGINGSDGSILWSYTITNLLDGRAWLQYAGDLTGDGRSDAIINTDYRKSTYDYTYYRNTTALNGYNGTKLWETEVPQIQECFNTDGILCVVRYPILFIGNFDGNAKGDVLLTGNYSNTTNYVPLSIQRTQDHKLENNLARGRQEILSSKMDPWVKQRILGEMEKEEFRTGMIEMQAEEQTTTNLNSYAKAFSGDNINNAIWDIYSGNSIYPVWSWSMSPQEPGVDYNADGFSDVALVVDNTIYMLVANVTSSPPSGGGSISGFKINDTNGNGMWDSGEMGIENWNIILKSDTMQMTAITDINGFYKFMNLTPSSYNVTEEMKPGFTATNVTYRTILVENMDITNVNFTNQPVIPKVTGSISGFKINDTNGNGKWDSGEIGIENWNIRLIGITSRGNDTSIIRKESFTDATGFYTFDNLPAGRYFVVEKLKKGFIPTGSPVKRIKLAQDENPMNNNFTNRPAHSLDEIDGQSDVDDYEAINRNIDKNKEDMDWD
ncbi:MAG: PQQ-binding-like beta-propeller repeat protein, partial [Candidatus Methanoperedens sp.]|nr:PQQ-binding-like beta-propeller repeat protein [Candidatus Methanoperedens sp.]